MAITNKARVIAARKKVVRQQIIDLKASAEKVCRSLPAWVLSGDVRAAQAWKQGAFLLHKNIGKAIAGRATLEQLIELRDKIEFEITSLEAGV